MAGPSDGIVRRKGEGSSVMSWQVQWEDPEEARVLEVPQVVALEQAIAADGTSLAELMDRAGASAARFITDRWDSQSSVLVFCGTGNNGGDGWVVGELLAKAGYLVTLVTPVDPEDIVAHPAHEAAVRCATEIADKGSAAIEIAPEEERVRALVSHADVVVDALLGTGFHYDSLREPTRTYVGALAHAVAERDTESGSAVNKESTTTLPVIVAIDVPSGLNAQAGTAADPVVRADYTVTMMTLKPGLVDSKGAGLCGKIAVARIAGIEKYL